ncbi:MAG TPA: hypothetical protein VFE02_09805 [Candidatus Acidoferrales bacterium]|jgi:hypothetical protein|nr:hypothetical protein [Candidatus Acidoferrales bacterium]
MRRLPEWEMLCSTPIDPFVFRLQPILEVITNQSAMGAVDLVCAIQNLFDLRCFANSIYAGDHFLRFNLPRDFGM